ncbi:hypothetical protein C266_13874 [Pandoraea sp. SD6-2]|nr:hypothetical protein C266_13874 [Pandoraea sp. SD6-2]
MSYLAPIFVNAKLFKFESIEKKVEAEAWVRARPRPIDLAEFLREFPDASPKGELRPGGGISA